jgi:hypothetical protein
MNALLARYADIRLLDERPSYRPTFVLRGLRELNIAVA